MSTAIIVGLIVVGIVAGTVFTLKSTARMGMPSKDVVDRAGQRSKELESRDKAEHDN